MTKLLIAFNGTEETGQFPGDQLCSIKVAYLFAQHSGCDKIMMSMSPSNSLHFMWQKFLDTYDVEIVYDTFHPGNMEQRFSAWNQWRSDRSIEGRAFDVYKELYRRIDGSHRQHRLTGGENGLRRRNIFEYFFYGQEPFKFFSPDDPSLAEALASFDDSMVYHPVQAPERDVFLAPYAKCQGNAMFAFTPYWSNVVHRLIGAGVSVTVNFNGNFCEDLNGHPLYRKIYPPFKGVFEELANHKIVACGNTGIGWAAFAAGRPVLAMQPPDSNMPDYRYEKCGCATLVEFMESPDDAYCARRLAEEVGRVTVFTTGCYDVIHAGHIRHLEESRSLGSKLIVALNSDSSVRKLKGEGRPVNNQEQRAAVVSAIRFVDEVRIFDGDDAEKLIRELRPHVITNGCDHAIETVVGKSFVESYGGRAAITGGTRDQSSTKIIRATVKPRDVMKAVEDGCAVAINPPEKMRLLAREFMSVSSLEGDVADVGAYRGGCSLVLKRLAPDKVLHVIDTWNGTPFDDDLCHHKKGEWLANFDECKAFVGEDKMTLFHRGIFPDETGPDVLDSCISGRFCFVFVDPDTYQSVKAAIEFFWPRVTPGGKMMFDDYGWSPCAGVQKAVDEAFPGDEKKALPSFSCVVTKP